MVRLGVVVATAFAVLVCAAPASAVVVTRYAGLATGSLPDGIAAGSDGSVFVAEESVDKISKMATTGLFQPGGSGGDRPTSLVTGPSVAGPRGSGSIWASLTNAKAILRIDSLTGASETIPTTSISDCGPRGIAVGPTAGFMYFTLPNPGDGSCTSPSMIGWVPTATFTPVSGTTGFGSALDLDSTAGKLFVPDPDANVIRRAAVDPTTGAPTIDGTFPIPGGGSPRGITTSANGTVWSTLWNAGAVARVAAGAADGTQAEVIAPGGAFGQPFGIATSADGAVFAASYANDRIARFAPDGSVSTYDLGSAYSPWQLGASPDGDIWFTNRDQNNIGRLVDGPPKATTGNNSPGPTDVFVSGIVDPVGNTTEAYYEYGETTAYGRRTESTTLEPETNFVPAPPPAINPQPLDPIPVRLVQAGGQMTDLRPNTSYHYRLVTVNSRGTAYGNDRIVTTTPAEDNDKDGYGPPEDCDDNDAKINPKAVDKPGDGIDQDCSGADAKHPRLRARIALTGRAAGSRTVISRLRITRLAGGETVRVTCKTKRGRCPFSTRTRSKVKKGSLNLDRWFRGRSVRAGARIVVRVTKAGSVGASLSATARTGRRPTLVRRCLRPGAKAPSRC